MNVSRESILVMILMSFINVLDYFHRYIPSTLKDQIKADLYLSDFQTGVVYTSFIVSYMIVCPIIGFVAIKWNFKRKYVIAAGIILWSIATSVTGLCNSFYIILIPRILFGIGEAIYGTLGPALLCDFFIPSQRSIIMSIFYAATPVGCALGYIIAGQMGQYIGWRLTCLYLGIPGVIALVLLFIREPKVGEKDTEETHSLLESFNTEEPHGSLLNWTYVFTVAGFVAVTFGMGGFSDWLPVYFIRYYEMSVQKSGFITGVIVVVGGLSGAVCGGFVTEFVKKHITSHHTYFLVSGISMGVCAIMAAIALYCCNNILITVLITFGFSVFFGWWYNGPINGIIQNCVPAKLRPQANGVCVLFIHLFGDAISPSIIGVVSDHTNHNLRIALIMIPISFAISALIWTIGWFVVPIKRQITTDGSINTVVSDNVVISV
jgi:MFS family permease